MPSNVRAADEAQARIQELEARCRMLEEELIRQQYTAEHSFPGTYFRAWSTEDDSAEFSVSSTEFRRAFGLPERIRPHRLYEVVTPNDAKRMRAAFRRSMETGEPVHEEVPMVTISGEVAWMLVEAVARKDDYGTIIWDGRVARVYSRDDEELSLTEEEAHYRALFEASPIIQFLVDSENLTVLDANPAACSFYGYARGGFRGLHISQISADNSAEAKLEQASSKLQMRFECTHSCADFSTKDVESHITPVLYKGRRAFHYTIIDDSQVRAAQQEVTHQRELLANTLTHMAQGIVAFDAKGRVTLWNDRVVELMALPDGVLERHEFFGDALREAFDEHGDEGLEQMLAMLKVDEELCFEFKSCTGVAVEIRQTPLPDGGKVRTYTDITDRKQSEEKLSQANAELEAIFDNSQLGIAMTKGDRFLNRINRTFLSLFGAADDEEKVLGQHVSVGHVDALSAAYFKEQYYDRLRSGDVLDVEYPFKRVDGSIFWGSVSGKAIDPSDLDKGAVWVMKDVTESKQAKEALEASELRFRSFVENASDMLLSFTTDCNVTYVSPNCTDLLGLKPDELLGENLMLFCHPADRVELASLVADAEEGAGRHAELRMQAEGGRYRWYELSLSTESGVGENMSHIAIVRNIAERKRIEAMHKDMEHIMRHDLKAPLGVAINAPQLIQQKGPLTQEQNNLLDMIRESGQQVLEMVNTSLDVYKLEGGTYSLREELVNVNELLSRIMGDLTPVAGRRSQKLQFDFPATDIAIWGEPLLLYSLFSNLVKNGLEAAAAGESVSVFASSREQNVDVVIVNPGEVPARVLPRFFDKYVTAGKSKGTGLGTYAAKLAAEAHGGSVAVRSKGGMTSITVSLPIR